MKILILTVGLPRSGKSTWAMETGFPVVNPDSIRLALHGEAFIPKTEPIVWTFARYMVDSLFIAGHEKVVLDATNLDPYKRHEWKSRDWELEYKNFLVPAEVCIQRAKNNKKENLIPVIQKMNKKLEEQVFYYPLEGWFPINRIEL